MLKNLTYLTGGSPRNGITQPEHVNSVELGYRAVLFKNFYIDLSVYHAWYYNLIGYDHLYLLYGEVSDQESVVNSLIDSLPERLVHSQSIQSKPTDQ